MFPPDWVLKAWIPACALLFAVLRPARACTLAVLIGWLALPMSKIPIKGLPDLDKVTTTSVGILLGTLFFQTNQLRGFRIGWGEVLVFFFASAAVITSVNNGLGAHDGYASMVDKLLWYGLPYMFGRVFLRTREDFRDACQVVVGAAAVYGLLAMWEWRMSPQIHNRLYGFFQHSWLLGARWGFFRPIVCFSSNLGLGGFFCWTGLLAVFLYRGGMLRPMLGIPALGWAIAPLVGLVTSMSFGPWGLFLIGLGLVFFWQAKRWRALMWVAPMFTLIWMSARYTGMSDGKWLTDLVAELSRERASSLQYRIDAETKFVAKSKAPGHEWFGWGGWGRNRIRDESGKDLVALDGLWLILLSTYGLVGLMLFFTWWMYPLLQAVRAGAWLERDPAMLVLLVAVGLQAVNFLFNAFLDPVLTMLVGAAALQLERGGAGQPAHVPAPAGRRRSAPESYRAHGRTVPEGLHRGRHAADGGSPITS